ncbi:DUF4145 domain-containing protein [Kribbella sp. NPDC051952]|uniref:DUF4145 domain-containing protein n=1 Tax=Kribbella sp. NPDC051952 TaxID=3154851 RepID=UPI003437A610
MADDLRAFDGWFNPANWPVSTCPTCKLGQLMLKDPVTIIEGTQSKNARDHEDWDPDWINGYFQGVLRCGRSGCGEIVLATGEWAVTWDPNGQYSDVLRLRFAIPALPLAVPPTGTPLEVIDRIDEASRVVWSDPASAANGLRRAVESLLDAQKVRKTAGNGRRTKLSTHARIEEFKAKRPVAAQSLMAVKWVGNQGSHGVSELTPTDCIESAEYLDHALRDLYDRRDADIVKRVKKVNKSRRIQRP